MEKQEFPATKKTRVVRWRSNQFQQQQKNCCTEQNSHMGGLAGEEEATAPKNDTGDETR